MSAFGNQFKVFDDIEKQINGLVPAVANEVFLRIYNRTPIDTGYAQSRWQMSVGGEDFVITNDAPYISYLEDGWSQQAPNGMVALTINEVPKIIEDYARRKANVC